jgi:hypothetical protein
VLVGVDGQRRDLNRLAADGFDTALGKGDFADQPVKAAVVVGVVVGVVVRCCYLQYPVQVN